MFSGTHQVVHVSTEPEGCTVLVDDGRTSTTPCDLSMRRGRTHTLKLVKDGYRSRDVKLHSAFNYVSLANILVFPPLGSLVVFTIDEISGAMWRVDPSVVSVKLEPAVGPAAEAAAVGTTQK